MKRSLLLLPALLLATAASALDAFDARVADIGILQAKQIQAELKITPAQLKKMNAAADAHRARLEAYQKTMQALGSVTPDKKRLQALFDTLKQEVFAALTPGQVARLRELTLQRLGLISLTDAQVAARVGLSSKQIADLKLTFAAGRTKFQAVQKKYTEPIFAQYKGRKAKTPAEGQALKAEIIAKLKATEPQAKPQLEAVGKATDAAMLAVLTPTQKAKWAALKGVPFKAK